MTFGTEIKGIRITNVIEIFNETDRIWIAKKNVREQSPVLSPIISHHTKISDFNKTFNKNKKKTGFKNNLFILINYLKIYRVNKNKVITWLKA